MKYDIKMSTDKRETFERVQISRFFNYLLKFSPQLRGIFWWPQQRAICKSFLCVKALFSANLQKFSPSKVSFRARVTDY